ncbi:hypothetical protein [Algoriphagus zhangzhouensis]|nr:hypothetical protein [Algoriphagus zhangzhouensis]
MNIWKATSIVYGLWTMDYGQSLISQSLIMKIGLPVCEQELFWKSNPM